ncbi:MAG TPA: hypothetical protein VF836_09175 [Gemmatimonadaceae bacterium]
MKPTDSEVTNPNATSDTTIDEGVAANRTRGLASSMKERAATIPAILADGLEAGAEVLRQQRARSSATTPGTSVAVPHDSPITELTDTLASGMKSSADWIRDADLEKLKGGVEKQIKEHPGRSLLVALGAGFLLGKILRR